MKLMKHNFLTIIIATIFTLITGMVSGKELPPVMQIKLDQHFSYLEVSDHISVVLTNETGKDISVDGDRSMFGKVRFLVKKGKLSIWLYGNNKGEKLTVYVPARLLRQLVINGDSKVVTKEALDNEKLDVVVNGACQLSLRSKGKINIAGTNEFEFRHSYE